jgi:hypothetical protein
LLHGFADFFLNDYHLPPIIAEEALINTWILLGPYLLAVLQDTGNYYGTGAQQS